MRQCRVEDNRYEMLVNDIQEFERPPMIEIPEYMERFHPKDKASG